jgi:hypothetical protein
MIQVLGFWLFSWGGGWSFHPRRFERGRSNLAPNQQPRQNLNGTTGTHVPKTIITRAKHTHATSEGRNTARRCNCCSTVSSIHVPVWRRNPKRRHSFTVQLCISYDKFLSIETYVRHIDQQHPTKPRPLWWQHKSCVIHKGRWPPGPSTVANVVSPASAASPLSSPALRAGGGLAQTVHHFRIAGPRCPRKPHRRSYCSEQSHAWRYSAPARVFPHFSRKTGRRALEATIQLQDCKILGSSWSPLLQTANRTV